MSSVSFVNEVLFSQFFSLSSLVDHMSNDETKYELNQ